MFSGIVEKMAQVLKIEQEQGNKHFTLRNPFDEALSIDQSIAHNGVCLTVVKYDADTKEYVVTAMQETLNRSNLDVVRVGDFVNLERSMLPGERLDGHIVQGHVDQTAECVAKIDQQGSYTFRFQYLFDKEMAKKGYMTVDKGSVTVNGVSLTVCNPTQNTFQVAIIPYTFEHTNFCDIKVGSIVNLEFDIIGKYIARLQQLA